MGSFYVALVTAALALTAIVKMGYGEQLAFCSHRLHLSALLKVLNTLV